MTEAIGRNEWLVFAYTVMLLVEADPEPSMTHIYRRLFERPKNVSLQAAVRKVQGESAANYVAYKLKQLPKVQRQVRQYASQVRDEERQQQQDIEILQDKGTRRPDILPGLASGGSLLELQHQEW